MRRWFAILLLVLLPLQALWAAAAPYCEHEQEPAKVHLGHHSHEHQDAAAGDGSPAGQAGAAHPDCHVCHGSAGAADLMTNADTSPFGTEYFSISGQSALPMPPPSRPERPNWQRLA